MNTQHTCNHDCLAPRLSHAQFLCSSREDPPARSQPDSDDEAEEIQVGSKYYGASLVVQRLKRLPAMWETWVQSLGQEDPLEKEMATHASILAWRIPWTEELGGLQSTGCKELDTTE